MKFKDEEKIMLIEASKDKHGSIIYAQSLSGLNIQINCKQFCDRGNPRSEAIWKKAIKNMTTLGFLETTPKGQIYYLTSEGYEIAGKLEIDPNYEYEISQTISPINIENVGVIGNNYQGTAIGLGELKTDIIAKTTDLNWWFLALFWGFILGIPASYIASWLFVWTDGK